MLKLQEIRELIELIDQSSIEEFVFEHDGSKVELRKSNQVVAAHVAALPTVQREIPQKMAQPIVNVEEEQIQTETVSTDHNDSLVKITSPMVGTFYQSSSPEQPPYVQVGSSVNKDSIVCIVEAMKLFNEIEAEVDGEIAEVLVKNGELVEYGQPLFLVKPY